MISRFAPAPTGHLHLGHVVNAIYVWGITRAAGGRVVLRIEDHDRQRSRPAFERALLEDLTWLGFAADGDADLVRQSERGAIYEAALATLRAQGRVYACECSRSGIADASPGGSEPRYPNRCAARGLPEQPGLGLRIRLDPTVERFTDLRLGPQAQCPAEQCGDLLVRDRAGNWTYQFAVVVDDCLQGVTHVIRGEDLLASTGRQIQLARLLGRAEPPAFLHHPLVMKTPTQKLSKSDGDTGIADLRRRGMLPADVIGEAAVRAGLLDRARPLPAEAVGALFR